MAVPSHLKSLQALDMALRMGSLKLAADWLGITPAAVGQRIRALEEYLGHDLLVRGRSGLHPTDELKGAVADLSIAFDALGRVTDTLDFQRVADIHVVAEADWAELWLAPRLPAFRAAHPNIRLCINGLGDMPLRLGAPDLRVTYDDGPGEPLYRERFLPVCGPDNLRRVANWDPQMTMEGLPLLHLTGQRDREDMPGWVGWFSRFGLRRDGQDRGVHYQSARVALEAVRGEVGFLVCGLSLVMDDLVRGSAVLPFPAVQNLPAPHPYRLMLREGAERRAQIGRFVQWLRDEAALTKAAMHQMLDAGPTPGEAGADSGAASEAKTPSQAGESLL